MDNYEIFNPKYTIDSILKKYSIDDVNNKPNIIIEFLVGKNKSKNIRWLYCLSNISTIPASKRLYKKHLNDIDYIGVLLKD
jgi:hypothetical protein